MQEKLEELRGTIEEYTITQEQQDMDKINAIAHDIANFALDYLSGDLLRRAMDIAVAVAELANSEAWEQATASQRMDIAVTAAELADALDF